MINIGKLLIFSGIGLIIIGVLFLGCFKLGIGKLPGDIYIEKGSFKLFFPVTTCILLSLIISLFFLILGKK